MSERISKTQRWLDLIALLLNRTVPLTVDEIMERIPAYAQPWATEDEVARASVRRMFERDKDELRAMGIPLESIPYTIHYGSEQIVGYRIAGKDFYLPYLRVVDGDSAERVLHGSGKEIRLEPEEARTALNALGAVAGLPGFPFHAEARAALSKLTFDLGTEELSGASVLQLETAESTQIREILHTLSEAILARKRVRFHYRGIQRGTPTDRSVEPYGLFLQRDWYLAGYDLDRQALRLFRVSRMEPPTTDTRSAKQPDFEVPADFDVQSLIGRRAWELSGAEPTRVEVRFLFPASLQVARSEEGMLLREEEDGAAIRSFEVADPNPFLRWVLGFAGDASIVSPPELKAQLRQMALEITTLYGM